MAMARVRMLRRRTGLKPEEFARLVGVSMQTVYRWEKAREPKIDPRSREFLELLSMLSTSALREVAKTCRIFGAWTAVREVLVRTLPYRAIRK